MVIDDDLDQYLPSSYEFDQKKGPENTSQHSLSSHHIKCSRLNFMAILCIFKIHKACHCRFHMKPEVESQHVEI